MKVSELAKQLRDRQLELGLAPAELINALSDEQIIICYVTCSDCHERLVEDEELVAIIAQAKDMHEFLELCANSSGGEHAHLETLQ